MKLSRDLNWVPPKFIYETLPIYIFRPQVGLIAAWKFVSYGTKDGSYCS